MISSKSISKSFLAAALCIASLSIHSVAFAAERDHGGTFFGKNAPGKWIIGLKVANIDPNEDEVQDADGLGIVLGYEFARSIGGGGSSTFELEYIDGDDEGAGDFFEYDANILNAFFTYRSAGTLYFKLKAGLTYSDVSVNSILGEEFDNEDVALAAGIGLGYRVLDYGVIELDYSQDSGDNELGIFGINGLLEF